MWLFLWRASLLYIFPLLMWAYCRIKDIGFAELDTGRRQKQQRQQNQQPLKLQLLLLQKPQQLQQKHLLRRL